MDGANSWRLPSMPSRKLLLSWLPMFRRRLTVSLGSALRSAYRLRRSSLPACASMLERRPCSGALLTRLTIPPWLPRP
ncbi:hypothetical protein D3C85_1398710 [compost metagenome]